MKETFKQLIEETTATYKKVLQAVERDTALGRSEDAHNFAMTLANLSLTLQNLYEPIAPKDSWEEEA